MEFIMLCYPVREVMLWQRVGLLSRSAAVEAVVTRRCRGLEGPTWLWDGWEYGRGGSLFQQLSCAIQLTKATRNSLTVAAMESPLMVLVSTSTQTFIQSPNQAQFCTSIISTFYPSYTALVEWQYVKLIVKIMHEFMLVSHVILVISK